MTKTQTEREAVRNDHPDSWIAVNVGDSIMGKIVDVTDAWSDQRRDPITNRPGSLYPLLVLDATDATGYADLPRELKVHCFGAVLFNEIMRKQPAIGEAIRITYQGPGEAKPGQNAPELYSVRAAAGADVAKRAYDKIGGGRPGQHSSEPVQGSLPVSDDDIPF
jgi:hypothetical protein